MRENALWLSSNPLFLKKEKKICKHFRQTAMQKLKIRILRSDMQNGIFQRWAFETNAFSNPYYFAIVKRLTGGTVLGLVQHTGRLMKWGNCQLAAEEKQSTPQLWWWHVLLLSASLCLPSLTDEFPNGKQLKILLLRWRIYPKVSTLSGSRVSMNRSQTVIHMVWSTCREHCTFDLPNKT